MPRPKGSKNKKTLEREKRLAGQIQQLEAARAALAEELAATEAIAAEQKEKAKDIRAHLRKLDSELNRMRIRAEAAQADAEREKVKSSLSDAVKELMSSGLTAEEILKKVD